MIKTDVLNKVKHIDGMRTDISDIQNELQKSINTKYQTVNGVKEFECKDGYIDNLYIPGETLVNLCELKNSYTAETTLGYQTHITDKHKYKGNTKYTFFNLSPIAMVFDIGSVSANTWIYNFTVPPFSNVVKTLNDNEQLKTVYYSKTSGATDADLPKLKCLVLEGDYSSRMFPYFKGIGSVGQGDKIEVINRFEDNKNIFYGDLELGMFDDVTGEPKATNNCVRSKDFIKVNPGSRIVFSNDKGYSRNVYYYDINKNYIDWKGNEEYKNVPSNCHYIKFRSNVGSVQNDLTVKYQIEYSEVATEYVSPKYSKNTISETCRSLPNGVKDEIIQQGDRYFKIIRCGEFIHDGRDGFYLEGNDIRWHVKIKLDGVVNSGTNLFCNIFKAEGSLNPGNVWIENGNIECCISNKIVPDFNNVKQYLKDNNFTIIYELATPQIMEIPNPNIRTFKGKNTFMVNAGPVQSEVNFEITNSLSDMIDVMSGKIASLDNTCEMVSSDIRNLKLKTNSDFDSLGLTDSSFSATDLSANIKMLMQKVGRNARLSFYVYSGRMNNLNQSIKAYLGTSSIDGYGVDIMTTTNDACSNPIYIYPNNTSDIYFLNYDNSLRKGGKLVFSSTLSLIEEQIIQQDIEIKSAKQENADLYFELMMNGVI